MSAATCLSSKPGNWSAQFVPVCQKPAGHEGPHESQSTPGPVESTLGWIDEPAIGRKKSERRQRTRVVAFRMTPTEYAALAQRAEREGITVGALVRSAVA